MPIRTKILAGCLALSLLTVLLGFVAEQAEQRLGAVALGIYDNAFMAVSYLRSAQINFAQLAAQSAQAPQDQADAAAKKVSRQAALQDILDDLDVVQERAMSPTGHSLATNLREQVTHVLPELGSDPVAEAAIGRGFERLVETFADDGFRYRRDVGRMVVQQEQQMVAAIAASLLVALAITALVTHLIAPPVRHAVRVAEAIAAGRLDTHIEVRGRGETGDLLRALSVMQASIAAGVARIQALIAEQAASHAGQMAARNAQLDAALGNMTQGLCMFDDSGRLVIANRRFGDMFKPPTPGQSLDDVLTGAGLSAVMDISRGGAVPAFACTIADGRSLSISQRPVAGGGWVATYDDVSERVAAEESLAHMARHDVLTGLGNRLMFAEHLQRMLVSPQTEGRAALLYLDLDRFKPVNDALGHPVGDALLRLVSERLLACVGGDDLVVRLGGDEFAVVQTSATQPTEASRLAQRIIDSLSEPYDIDDHLVLIGTSVGIALVQDNANADDLLKCADLALYRAKRDGRGIFRFFEPEMDTRMQVRRLLEHDLRLAVLREEMELYYQPLMHGKNGISGFEALLRWRHAERGIVSPTEFVPIAEELGLMPVLGRWVLRQACADAAAWPGDLKVAINLSPLQFTGLLVNDVQTALEMSGLPGNRLELEITESVLLQDDDAVLPTLHALRALGARIAMDDFGTGYSSLGYLQRFPFDKIKIDQSFVRNMTNRKDCLAIVRAVIGLGRSLGMSVNAEGVETQDQLAALLNEGCDELQGFLFSRPQPAVQVDEMLLQLGTWSNTPRLMAPTV